MNKNVKAALVVAVVLAVLGDFVWHAVNERGKMTATAKATVLKSEFVRDLESSSLDETRIAYQFEAAGKAVQGQNSIPGSTDQTADYPAGRTIEICYNPEDPVSSRLKSGDSCG